MNSHFSKLAPRHSHKYSESRTHTFFYFDKTSKRVVETKKGASMLHSKKTESEQNKQDSEVTLSKLMYSMHLEEEFLKECAEWDTLT